MRTLILSCNTGAGHNSCAKAIQEVYQSRGDMCDIYDALLFISKRASKFISNWHTRIYLHAPKIFSSGYEKAEEKDDLFREGTPVYKYITSGADRMYDYIVSGGYDNVICTHVFPALALTEVRRRHPDLRVTTSHVSTDYTELIFIMPPLPFRTTVSRGTLMSATSCVVSFRCATMMVSVR